MRRDRKINNLPQFRNLKNDLYSSVSDLVWYVSHIGADMIPRFYDQYTNKPSYLFKNEI